MSALTMVANVFSWPPLRLRHVRGGMDRSRPVLTFCSVTKPTGRSLDKLPFVRNDISRRGQKNDCRDVVEHASFILLLISVVPWPFARKLVPRYWNVSASSNGALSKRTVWRCSLVMRVDMALVFKAVIPTAAVCSLTALNRPYFYSKTQYHRSNRG